jgi:hypothetical protein
MIFIYLFALNGITKFPPEPMAGGDDFDPSMKFGDILGQFPANGRKTGNRCYSQRNTFAERAVQMTNTTASAATSPMCGHHASPFHIPSMSDTA